MDRLQGLVEYLVKGLVDQPDQVSVSRTESGDTSVYEIGVADGDLGKVIGREGRTANALRQLVRAAATNLRVKAAIEILS